MDVVGAFVRFLIIGAVAGLLVPLVIRVGSGPFWRPYARPWDEIRAPRYVTFTVWLCLAAAFLFGVAGLAGNVLGRGPDQYLPWGGVVGFFALIGFVMISETRTVVRFDPTGLTWRGRLTGWRRAAWSDVVRMVYSQWSSMLVLKLRDGRQILVSEHSAGVGDLLVAAYAARVPGAELFVDNDAED